MIISKPEELKKHYLEGNEFIGAVPLMENSKLIINGKNNLLVCEDNVKLMDCYIEYKGNNSLIYLSNNKHYYKLSIDIYSNSTIFIGRDNYFNRNLHAIISEEQNFLIGNECLFSTDIWVRNADAHLIYDIDTNKRINSSKSIFIGDRVWIGQDVFLFKGIEIDSGSIIGAKSMASNKRIGCNELWAGNPIRLIKKNVYWDNTCVHSFDKAKTKSSMKYSINLNKDNKSVYSFNKNQCIPYNEIDKYFKSHTSIENYTFIKSKLVKETKNRFVHDSAQSQNLFNIIFKNKKGNN